MKIEFLLDHNKVLAGQSGRVNGALKLHASKLETKGRDPIAFALVIDCSGSMSGEPLDQALAACRHVIHNLRPEDYLSVVTFGDCAVVHVPLQQVGAHKSELAEVIDRISIDGSTNLAAGWALGRDELKKAQSGVRRKILLLTDGQLNAGITDPIRIQQLVGHSNDVDTIRTSTLGFGWHFNEDLLLKMAECGSGEFHLVDSPEKFPAVFGVELDGLLSISAQNVRLRVKPLDFCVEVQQLSAYPENELPDGWREYALGDLISDENRVMVLSLDVPPIPLAPDGQLVASIEGENVLAIEVVYDEITETDIRSCQYQQTIKLQSTQDESEIVLNEDVMPWVVVQDSGKLIKQAQNLADRGDFSKARELVQVEIAKLRLLSHHQMVADSIGILQEFLQQIDSIATYRAEGRKRSTYGMSKLRRLSNKTVMTTAQSKLSMILDLKEHEKSQDDNSPDDPTENKEPDDPQTQT